MTTTAGSEKTISAPELAEGLARGEERTLLDVREDPDSGVEAPGARSLRRPAAEVTADPAAAAETLAGPVTVVCNRGMTAQEVAKALRGKGVDATALAGGVRAWLGVLQAREVDLGVDGLAVRQVQRPGRGCLSYLLASGSQALVVDPAPDAGFYVALAAELGARITDVFDTHLHADHLSGARELADLTGAVLRLPAGALERGVAFAERVEPLSDGQTLDVGGITIRALALPGHTSDMMGLIVAGRALIGGDSVFADGIARPDLEQGDPEGASAMARTLHGTLRDRVLALGDDVVLLPGHTAPGVNPGVIAPTLAEVRAAVPELSIDDPDAFADALLAAMPPRPANYETVIAVNAGRHAFDPELETGGNSCSTG